jgi:hypothetical protein
MTRKRAHIDRTACPWLIRRFIDPDAEFLFVEPRDLLASGERIGANTFDAPQARYTHRGRKCTFQVLLEEFGLEADAALVLMGEIIRDADIVFRKRKRPEANGVEAVIRGLTLTTPDDHEKLEISAPLYDALYAYCDHVLRDAATAP